MSPRPHGVDEVADGVFLARGADVNWVLLRDGRDVTLIDTGYPGYLDEVLRSLTRIGAEPENVAAVLITHAHVDHVGGANYFARTHGTPVYTGAVEARHARREYLEQAGPVDVVKNLGRSGALPWLRRVLRAGAMSKTGIPSAEQFPTVLELPGGPVPVLTGGHTSGHTAYHLPGARAVVTGDELATGHGLLPRSGPALLPAFFSHGDTRGAVQKLAGLDAELILPGHGTALRQPIADAVAEALSS